MKERKPTKWLIKNASQLVKDVCAPYGCQSATRSGEVYSCSTLKPAELVRALQGDGCKETNIPGIVGVTVKANTKPDKTHRLTPF